MSDRFEEEARRLLDDPENFVKDPVAGPIPMHFNAFYGKLAGALRDTARRARIEALEECVGLAGKQLMTSHRRANMDYGWNGACRAIAAAISALKEKG
jgi:hypothetical protein